MKISVLIPAFNVGTSIGTTINSVKSSCPQLEEIIVIDDGSMDDTSKQAELAGAQVIRLDRNRGKGEALNHGANWVQGDIVVLLDADLGESAEKFNCLLTPVIKNQADVTIAKFPPPPIKGGFGCVKGLAHLGILCLTGKSITCPLSGQRAMTRKVFNSLLPFAQGYGVEVAATVDILKKNWRVEEVAIDMMHAYTGRNISGFFHRGRQFFDIFFTLIQKSVGE
ncbi:MAG: glycosyltransferase family 2 protein [Dehalobacterium sp.]